MAIKKLSILFLKDGFSFCVIKDDQLVHQERVQYDARLDVSYFEFLSQRIDQQLYLNQTYDEVNVAYLGSQFNLVPVAYFEQDNDAQKWLEFNAEIYEGDQIEVSDLAFIKAKMIYAIPIELQKIVARKFDGTQIKSASAVFMNSFEPETDDAQVFLNIHQSQLEILVFKNQQLLFYNIFEIATKEDLVYYVLNALKQLNLDPNEVEVYYFGGNTPDESLKMLMNFVRHLMPGTADATSLALYTETQNLL